MKTFEEGMSMSGIRKEDCITTKDALEALGVSRASFFNYMAILRVDRHKFSLDKNMYISRADFERLKSFTESRRS